MAKVVCVATSAAVVFCAPAVSVRSFRRSGRLETAFTTGDSVIGQFRSEEAADISRAAFFRSSFGAGTFGATGFCFEGALFTRISAGFWTMGLATLVTGGFRSESACFVEAKSAEILAAFWTLDDATSAAGSFETESGFWSEEDGIAGESDKAGGDLSATLGGIPTDRAGCAATLSAGWRGGRESRRAGNSRATHSRIFRRASSGKFSNWMPASFLDSPTHTMFPLVSTS